MSSKRLSVSALLCSLAVTGFVPAALPSRAAAQDRTIAAQPKADAAGQTDATTKSKQDNDEPLPASAVKNPVLWHEQKDIATLDLRYGPGGAEKQPKPPFVFLEEDHNGTNPKMDVRDADGTKWRVKEGDETRPEVVASRLLWAVGYFANEDYIVQDGTVSGITMKRGSRELKAGMLHDVRFARKPGGQKKIATWEWKSNPFTGTREFNGLRVMMAVMNNWDLKDVNNAVYLDRKTQRQIFLVSDVGATFGANGVGWTTARSKGNVNSFRDSKFVERLTATEVDFSTPKKPRGILIATGGATLKSYSMRKDLDWIGDNIPRADARWIGTQLSQLSHQQLVDAFRAGAFPEDQIASYVEVVESRIAELKKL